jgi:hypothetical protein
METSFKKLPSKTAKTLRNLKYLYWDTLVIALGVTIAMWFEKDLTNNQWLWLFLVIVVNSIAHCLYYGYQRGLGIEKFHHRVISGAYYIFYMMAALVLLGDLMILWNALSVLIFSAVIASAIYYLLIGLGQLWGKKKRLEE